MHYWVRERDWHWQMDPQMVSSGNRNHHMVVSLVHSAFPKTRRPPLSLPFSNFHSQRSLFIPNNLTLQKTNHTLSSTAKRISQTNVTCSVQRNRNSPAKLLRLILDSPGVHQGPCCFDALSAKLIEKAGFDYCFTSGTPFFFLFFSLAFLNAYNLVICALSLLMYWKARCGFGLIWKHR